MRRLPSGAYRLAETENPRGVLSPHHKWSVMRPDYTQPTWAVYRPGKVTALDGSTADYMATSWEAAMRYATVRARRWPFPLDASLTESIIGA